MIVELLVVEVQSLERNIAQLLSVNATRVICQGLFFFFLLFIPFIFHSFYLFPPLFCSLFRYVGKKSRSCAYNHPALSLRTTIKSGSRMKGLFTSKKIRKGEVVLVFAGKVVTREELEQYPSHVLHLTLQVHYNLWQAPDLTVDSLQISDYINHSCGANCALLDSTTMVFLSLIFKVFHFSDFFFFLCLKIKIAFRDIEAGEELTFDYGTVQDGTSGYPCDNFDCHCGSPACRHKMTPHDWQLKEVQDRYFFLKKKKQTFKHSFSFISSFHLDIGHTFLLSSRCSFKIQELDPTTYHPSVVFLNATRNQKKFQKSTKKKSPFFFCPKFLFFGCFREVVNGGKQNICKKFLLISCSFFM